MRGSGRDPSSAESRAESVAGRTRMRLGADIRPRLWVRRHDLPFELLAEILEACWANPMLTGRFAAARCLCVAAWKRIWVCLQRLSMLRRVVCVEKLGPAELAMFMLPSSA